MRPGFRTNKWITSQRQPVYKSWKWRLSSWLKEQCLCLNDQQMEISQTTECYVISEDAKSFEWKNRKWHKSYHDESAFKRRTMGWLAALMMADMVDSDGVSWTLDSWRSDATDYLWSPAYVESLNLRLHWLPKVFVSWLYLWVGTGLNPEDLWKDLIVKVKTSLRFASLRFASLHLQLKYQ